MDAERLEEIRTWVTKAGLYGTFEPDVLRRFCKGLHKAGLPVARALVAIDALHPVHEGRVFHWEERPGSREPGGPLVPGQTMAAI